MKSSIKALYAREVFTTKGFPTIEVDVLLEDGSLGRAAAPGGTSRGTREVRDLTDGDLSYFNGMGVTNAIGKATGIIADALRGKDACNQEAIDRLLIDIDGTRDKSSLGGNTTVAVSIACAKAAATSRGIELFRHFGSGIDIPVPFIYVMFGGPAYVGGEVCDLQEYALIPLKAKSYREGYLSALGMYRRLCSLIAEKNGYTTAHYAKVAGIPIARFDTNEDALAVLTELIEAEGFRPGEDFGIHTDVAANQLYHDGRYHLRADGIILSREAMIDRLADLCTHYPIISLEDPLFEEDWEGWKILTERIGNRVQVLGDDLFATNPERLSRGIAMGAANAIVIKPNQIGTLTETMETIALAKAAQWGTVISPRSGELWDPYLAHLCVGQGLGQGKLSGAYSSGESNVNELIRISDALGGDAVLRDGRIFPHT